MSTGDSVLAPDTMLKGASCALQDRFAAGPARAADAVDDLLQIRSQEALSLSRQAAFGSFNFLLDIPNGLACQMLLKVQASKLIRGTSKAEQCAICAA